MMKTEISTNGEAPIEAREHRRATITQDHKRTGSAHLDKPSNRSGEEKKRSLFQRPGVIVAAAALAIAGIGYGGIVMFHSFTHETTDDAFVEVHAVSVAPNVAGHVAEVRVDDNELVKKGDVLVEIDPRDFQVALAQVKANLARDKATQIQAELNEKRALDLFSRKVISTQERDTNVATAESSRASVQADEAAVEQAELNLGYSKIKAPIDGYVTKEAVATGNYVKVVQRVPVKIMLDGEQQMQRVLGPGMSVVPTVAMDHGNEAAFVIAIIAVVLVAGVILGAALWIGRVRRGQA